MKSRILLLAAIALISVVGVEAQGLKIGYADANYILSLMPEAKQAETEITTHQNMIRANLEAKYKDYQTKLGVYQETAATLSEIDRADKERELLAIQESIQKYEEEGQSSAQKKQADLLQPLFQKIGKAIEEVSIENNYDFIFSAGSQGVDILLYAKEDKNMTNLVLAKLGIDPPADN